MTIKKYGILWNWWEVAIKNDYKMLKYLPKKYKTLELCKLAVQTSSHALNYVPKEYIEQLSNMNIPIVELDNEKNDNIDKENE